ncbi:MAG: type II toxin-antitoxin system VapC family toxin [Propionicimonas sp.]|uniref:type II toxin-antitoxin system VapC family toxin n=1 Tax=Propionicimonas sp. TaxID=1955623 RepID=UPI002B21076D|nr:type II toxin-antitoxin system VapC family toxin [Propionicimonas sp.]MEA4945235.1 type II toxin-antitoxin system VapC family toxin [Propionicimonas sp.]MEA5055166.1 type II toxin-antitoxin system VapC family toxin [Propionicimonas sp.]
MILLDTNVVSEPLRPAPDLAVVAWLDAQAPETLYLSSITVAEVRFGIARLPEGRRRTMLGERFEGEVLPAFAGRIVGFDEPESAVYAGLRARAAASGVAISPFDALIAAIALHHSFAIATRDVGPFDRLGLKVVNPFGRGPTSD